MIELTKYMTQLEKNPEWQPGWEAILKAFSTVYGDSAPQLLQRGDLPGTGSGIDGFAIYRSANGYRHVVTRGLTRIRPHRDAWGQPVSGYGFELTIKWPNYLELDNALLLLDRVAQFVEVRHSAFRNPSFLSFTGRMRFEEFPLRSPSFAGVLIAEDTEVPAIQTMHGSVDFLQLVNIGINTVTMLTKTYIKRIQAKQKLKSTNPLLICDPYAIGGVGEDGRIMQIG